MTKRVKVTVSGRVQGVWYRASTRDKAVELGVRGYVRNLPNGDVEFVAVGEEQSVDALVEWARQGPPMARVENLRVEPLEDDVELDGFEVAF